MIYHFHFEAVIISMLMLNQHTPRGARVKTRAQSPQALVGGALGGDTGSLSSNFYFRPFAKTAPVQEPACGPCFYDKN